MPHFIDGSLHQCNIVAAMSMKSAILNKAYYVANARLKARLAVWPTTDLKRLTRVIAEAR